MKARHHTLGGLLRGLRARNGWTLKEMSERTQIPVSTLSKVEHDRLTLTYDKLLQLSQRLNIRMSELFADPAESGEAAVTARRSVGRMGDAVRVNTKNYDYYYLCPELRRKRMIPIHTRIRAKSVEEFGELVRHQGEEFIYVLEGAVEVLTEFYDAVVLHEGESIYIDSNMGHAYIAAEDCDEALVLAVCSSAEEGLLESLYSLHGDVEAVRPPAANARRRSARPLGKRATRRAR
ncbi:MAG: XRE family transcriptional regulator [Rudaea sp.]|uniref:helix-turn-helix domain-containing protein n=1 Tax=Rudaea sp. TaxID=2136325 RepID=UPI0039E38578